MFSELLKLVGSQINPAFCRNCRKRKRELNQRIAAVLTSLSDGEVVCSESLIIN
jgi:phosphatidylserine decarboxylase